MTFRTACLFITSAIGLLAGSARALPLQESLPPLANNQPPSSFEAVWAGYDPRREPLEVEVLKQWEQDGVVLKVVRYRIGVFKGQAAYMAGVYGFPQGGAHLPALLNIHGGGQAAHYNAVLTNAQRGYATLSLAWAGRLAAPGYSVGQPVVSLFWEGKTDHPDYKLTTDWGALDAYNNPPKNPGQNFVLIAPAPWTLDPVDSPRNSGWFLCALAARRALTFLEQQPEVDPARLGVYGHSMGGRITVLTTAADPRVKAAAPSCGGISDRHSPYPLYRDVLGDDIALARIACPVLFLSPSNDFHGRIDDLPKAIREIRSSEWRLSCSPHHNHQDTAEYQVAALLWFDQHLKQAFSFPATPSTQLQLHTASGVPLFSVKPDASRKILSVDIYYTQQGQNPGDRDNPDNTTHRFWHHASALIDGQVWSAEIPLLDTVRPLWVYANVLYSLEQPVIGAGYYYKTYTANTVSLSSALSITSPGELAAAAVKPTEQPSVVIESFAPGWQKEWFTYDLTGDWPRRTNKLHDPKWRAPANSRLGLEVRSRSPNTLVIGIDGYATEIALPGEDAWVELRLAPAQFTNARHDALVDWQAISQFRLGHTEILETEKGGSASRRALGGKWNGDAPEFRSLFWSAD